MKKIIRNAAIFYIILSLFALCFAAGSNTGNQNEGGTSGAANGRYAATYPYSGTYYKLIYQDSNGYDKTIEIYYDEGEVGYGNMQGYGSVDNDRNPNRNPARDGAVDIYPSDIEAALRKAGYGSAADAIANGAGYSMEVQQFLYVTDLQNGGTERMTIDRITAEGGDNWAAAGRGNIRYDLYSAYENSKDVWYDIDDDDQSHGIYWRKATPTPTPTLATTPPTTPTATATTAIDPEVDETPSPTPTPVPTPEQVIPQMTYEFREGGDNNCETGTRTTTEMAIDNSYFGVASGHAIPTSEDLDLIVKTNWIGNLQNVKESYIEITSASGVEYIQYYIVGYEIEETTYTYHYNSSGEYTGRTSDTETYATYSPHETAIEIPDNVKDSEGRTLISYDLYPTYAEYNRKDVSNELIGQQLPYLYTGDASITGGANAGVKNDVLPGGSAETTLNGFPSVEIVKNGRYPLGCWGAYNDPRRVTKNSDAPIEAMACCYAHAIIDYDNFHPTIGYFYNVQGDNPLTLTAYGTSRYGFDCNKRLVSQDFGKSSSYLEEFSNGIGTIPSDRQNRTTDGGYPTTDGWIEVGGERDHVTPINPVKVHTPIHATLTLTPTGTNQLTNDGLRNGSKIVTLGEKFEAELKATGSTVLYDGIRQSDWPDRMKKYIKYAEITCGFCHQTINVTDEVKRNGKATHSCRVYIDNADDLQAITLRGTVVAENISSMSSITYENGSTNTPDDSYAIEQRKGLFTVGKIYDLQVRATDDPSWKLKKLETLKDMPTGEAGDNSVSAYKNGIKLGYRAYYDLKTLGTGSEEVELQPKIYYVDKNGTLKGTIGSQYELWYKTSSTNYEKLQSGKDIITKMKVVTSKPDAFNIPFKEECAKLMKRLIERGVATIDYNKLITDMGGLVGLTLRKDNTVATKYTFYRRAAGTESLITDYTKPEDKSRRWYGEIYVPASTRIIATGNYNTNKTKVTNGTGIIKEGYIVVVFENIKSTTASGADYLKYDEVRDPDWNIPAGAKSQLATEKAGKTTIKLPNGKTFTSYSSSDAPVIIYDVSLRANNDYEQTGTH